MNKVSYCSLRSQDVYKRQETSRELKELDTKNTRAAEELEENQKAYEQTKVEYDLSLIHI